MKYVYIHICLCIFLFFLSNRWSVGAKIDTQYQACAPKFCGNQSISFPFFINGQQKPYCGTPGFNVTCQNNNTILQIQDDDQYLLVNQISYQYHTLRVSNTALRSEGGGGGGSCSTIRKTQNLTISGDKFVRVNNSNLVLLWNCSGLDERLKRYRVGCDNNNNNSSMLAMSGNNTELLRSGMEACKINVVAPIADDKISNSGRSEYYLEVMRKGFVLKWTATNCTECQSSGGRCGFNLQNYQFICFCKDRPHYRSCTTKSRNTSRVILATAISGTAVIILICLVIIVGRRRRWGLVFNSFLSRKTNSDIEDSISYFGVPVFSYKDLEDATNKFDPSKELGDGGYGTVYHGKLRDGREVAVKRLYENNFKRVEQFMNEIKILTTLRHRNLVLLYGSTSHRSHELLLVYEYIPNGTVADHLHGDRAENEPLSWPVRMQIAMETASALSYLHKSDIIHRDVKTNNILLDANFTVKVADFGLSRLFPTDATHVTTAPQGTPGYVDPEYHQCYQLTDKSDVYSFGVVLIELISSMPAVDISRSRNEINLANLAINRIQKCAFDELIDPSLGYKSDPTIERMTTSVAELAFQCLQLEKELRPTMDEVFERLSQIQAVDLSKRVPTPSPESDNVVLLKNRYFPTSPVTVIDNWTSSRSTTPSTSSNF